MSYEATYRTPVMSGNLSAQDKKGLDLAIEQAEIGLSEGGVPIGACLMENSTGKVLGVGRNRRVQMGSAIHHGETNCLENVGRLPGKVYKGCTMYTTLSACEMCTGSILMFGIGRVVMGENESWLSRGEQTFKERGIECINADNAKCKEMMQKFMKEKPEVWNEDIGV